MAQLDAQQVKQIIIQELPSIMQRDAEVRDFILRISREQFADKAETESRFDRVLNELQRDREIQERKWEESRAESNRRWEEANHRWEEGRVESNQRWEKNQAEIAQLFERLDRNREEANRRWEEGRAESNQRWEKNQEELRAQRNRIETRLGALGSRWGRDSEATFRNALRGILTDSFGVDVINVNEYDDKGEVHGVPDQVELDIIIKNGTLIICEIKAAVSKADVYVFQRKIKFYETHHNRLANRKLIISPFVDEKAVAAAHRLGMEVYSDAEDVDL